MHVQWLSDRPAPSFPWLGETLPAPPAVPDEIQRLIQRDQNCESFGWAPLSTAPLRIFDAILFHNELDLVEARMNELFRWVDTFFVLELDTSYAGDPKNPPSNFLACLEDNICRQRFHPFLKKVQFTLLSAAEKRFGSSCRKRENNYRWECEHAHRNLVSRAFAEAGGQKDDIVMFSDADEVPRASAAWALSHCEHSSKVQLHMDWFIYSTACRDRQLWVRAKAVTGGALGAGVRPQDLRMADGPDWEPMPNAGSHYSWFLTPFEVARKLGEFSHDEYNQAPFNRAAWHLDNVRTCTFDAAWRHREADRTPEADIRYPQVAWYAFANRAAMWRFHASPLDKDQQSLLAATPSASSGAKVRASKKLAVCLFDDLRNKYQHWGELRPAREVARLVRTFASVPDHACEIVTRNFGPDASKQVSCLSDRDYSADEAAFLESGPKCGTPADNKFVRRYRYIRSCRDLIDAYESRTGEHFDWILLKRADLFLRQVPYLDDLSQETVYTAYRDADLNHGGFNDALMFGAAAPMRNLMGFHSLFLNRSAWVGLMWLCAAARLNRHPPIKPGFSAEFRSAFARFNYFTNSSDLAPTILQGFLSAQGLPMQAHRELRYDITSWGNQEGWEISSARPLPKDTGIFTADVNTDMFANAYPRDPYFLAPLLSMLFREEAILGRKVDLVDIGCGAGHLVLQLLAWGIRAVGIDGYGGRSGVIGHWHWLLMPRGVRADLTKVNLRTLAHLLPYLSHGLQRATLHQLQAMDNTVRNVDINVFESAAIRLEQNQTGADWVVSLDVGCHIPRQLWDDFLALLAGVARRGIILRWGAGMHGLPEEAALTKTISKAGLRRDRLLERQFALFSGLIGPPRGLIFVFVRRWAVQIAAAGPPPASVMTALDPFEPAHSAAHFSEGEEVWREEEVELTAGYLRLRRALMHPAQAQQILAPLRLGALDCGDAEAHTSWGCADWSRMRCASWSVPQLLQGFLPPNRSELGAWCKAAGLGKLQALPDTESQSRCGGHGGSFADPLGHGGSFADALGAVLPPERPLGLHRRLWLSRLEARFTSG